jgi:hypothetical protein
LTIDPGKFFQPRRLARENKPAPSSCSPLPRAVIEVDLHADTLLDTLAGMESRDVLEHQMEVFHRVMEEYASCRGQQIIFIHGKGNGVLRQNLYRELRVRYKRHHYNYAPFQKYGHGATIVTIR